MIKHSYAGTEFTGKPTATKIEKLPGWFVTARTNAGGFAIIAKHDNGQGFSSRDKARQVIKALTTTPVE